MIEYLSEEATYYEHAVHELKRVDHLIYVSLKYTRTVDVLKNIIERLIATYDFLWDELLDRAERERKIFEIPTAPAKKVAEIKKVYSDEKLTESIKFYMLLRQFNNAQYSSHQEFRRHVTMRARFPNGDSKELNIDIITEYYKQTKEFVEYFKETFCDDD